MGSVMIYTELAVKRRAQTWMGTSSFEPSLTDFVTENGLGELQKGKQWQTDAQ